MSQRRADLLLVGISIIWGTTFTIVHETVAGFPALALIALRFMLAALVFVPALIQQRGQLGRQDVAVGVLLGAILFTGFATQTVGLQFTTPARGGFITGLNVVLVPLLGLAFGQRPPRRAVIGVVLAVVGLIVLSGCGVGWRNGPVVSCTSFATAGPQQQWGDLLIIICAFAFAMHIVAVSRWAGQLPVVPINAIQLLVVAVLASGLTFATEQPIPAPSLGTWSAALFLGLIATAFVFWLQLVLQRHTSATHTALIFALEPVFAALFSWLWIAEPLTPTVLVGGGLMLLGVISAEVSFARKSAARTLLAADSITLDGTG